MSSQVPDPVGFGGYVYAIEFVGDIVKVGRTSTPASRLDNHRGAGRGLGHDIACFWFSPHHSNVRENEKALIKLVAELGGQPTTTEFFTGVEFADVVAAAKGLTFVPAAPTKDDLPKRAAWTTVAAEALGEPLADWVARQRQTGLRACRGAIVPGQSWREVARRLKDATGVQVTAQTLLNHFGDLNRTTPSATS